MRIARAELSHWEHVHTGAAQLRLDLGRQALSGEPLLDHEGGERLDLEPDTVEIAEAFAIVDLRHQPATRKDTTGSATRKRHMRFASCVFIPLWPILSSATRGPTASPATHESACRSRRKSR